MITHQRCRLLLSILLSSTLILIVVMWSSLSRYNIAAKLLNMSTAVGVLSDVHYSPTRGHMQKDDPRGLSQNEDGLIGLPPNENKHSSHRHFRFRNTTDIITKTRNGNLNASTKHRPTSSFTNYSGIHQNNLLHVHTPSLAHSSGYILVIFYRQQILSATGEIVQLAALAAERRMQIVEPLVNVSYFQMPSIIHDHYATITHLGDLYNLTDVNQQLAKCLGTNYPIIAPFEEFAAAATSLTNVTLLNLMKGQIDKWCSNETQRQLKIEATEQLVDHHISRSVEDQGRNHPMSSYIHIMKAFCVDATGKINIGEVFSSILNTSTPAQKQLLVLPEWRTATPRVHSYYYYDPNYPRARCSIFELKHNAAVMKEMNHVWVDLNLSRPTLGIHIRIEHMRRYNTSTIKRCIGKLIAAAEALGVNHSVDLHNAIAIRDYGKLGTHSCGPCSRMAKEMGIDNQLQHLGINIMELNSTYTIAGASGESAFASFVEMGVVAQADYLLTVGGGSYQRWIIKTFLANHPKNRHFPIC